MTMQGRMFWEAYTEGGYLILSRQIRKIEGMDLSNLGTLVIAVEIEQMLHNILGDFNQIDMGGYMLAHQEQVIYLSQNILVEMLESFRWSLLRSYQMLSYNGSTYFSVLAQINYQTFCEFGASDG